MATLGQASTTSIIIIPRNPGNNRPEVQAEFHVAEEEPHGLFQRLVERHSQDFGHHVSGFQDPGADGANHEDPPVYLHLGKITCGESGGI